MPRSVPCPTCRRPAAWDDNPYRPFCSDRCRLLDIGNWTEERYRIAGPPVDTDDSGGDPEDTLH